MIKQQPGGVNGLTVDQAKSDLVLTYLVCCAISQKHVWVHKPTVSGPDVCTQHEYLTSSDFKVIDSDFPIFDPWKCYLTYITQKFTDLISL